MTDDEKDETETKIKQVYEDIADVSSEFCLHFFKLRSTQDNYVYMISDEYTICWFQKKTAVHV